MRDDRKKNKKDPYSLASTSLFKIHRGRIYGLGAAWDFTRLVDDEIEWEWTNCHLKIFLFLWTITINFPVSRKRECELSKWKRERGMK